ncbi:MULTISPECIES: ATP-binding protein [unclassified Polaromonas]|uniref:sensor histidine kinase n=1 Tax=unclassified Polaromonas TaxID=2638319 RepID=UPI0025F4BE66|nr:MULTISPECIES: ATP-binding protein [unclassified Polaromonas]HQR98820.1 ATP-binding protein [Polaromonas sp.]HQS40222.1 ATP-binding protein [Polaromonas sp.]HQS87896.1 ATP-binding protein [Polaromonas sp.]HQT06377.1 ATP-binding protein [Polaromonas sp.]
MAPLTLFKAWLKSLRGSRRALLPGARTGQARANAEALQAGLDLSSDGIVLLDNAGRVVAFNSCAQALMHSALGNLRGVDFWDAVQEEIADEYRGATEQALLETGSHSFVVWHAFENQWVDYCLRQHDNGLLVTLRDVSAVHQASRSLRNSESCNQTLFAAHPQAMWLLDTGSRHLLAVNNAAAALYGLAPEALRGAFVESLFPEGEGASLLDSLPPSDFQQEMRLCTQKRADGELMLVELACSSVQWDLRPAVLVSVTDVGARHLADAHLSRLNEELEIRIEQCTGELQRGRGEFDAFTSAMLHDLKAPLHVIDGFATTLAERHGTALDAQGQHYLARIQASSLQLARLIDDLRTLTYLPRMVMAPDRVDLAPVCLRIVAELRKREPARHLVLEMEPSLPLVCDKDQLSIALACLLDNAWKFTSRKEQSWIRVGLMPGENSADIVLSVSDNGAGFDTAYTDKLFTAFERLHSSVDFPGTGLGLAIVKRVAQLHGGEVWAVAADKGGASFFMSLPQESGSVSGSPPAA